MTNSDHTLPPSHFLSNLKNTLMTTLPIRC